MPPRGIGLWFSLTVDCYGASLASGGILVPLKEQRFKLWLCGTCRSQFLMKGSLVLYVGNTDSSPSLQQRTDTILTPRNTGHGKWKACHVLITGVAKFSAALEDQQLENRPGSLRISILELLATTAIHRSPGLCSLHLNGFHNARLSIYWTNI